MTFCSHSPIQQIQLPLFKKHNVSVFVKRDDLIHPIISGNKWRKLKYQLNDFNRNTDQGILSFGGCFSNHIHALAYATHQQNIPCVGLIRGEANAQNFTLNCAEKWQMKLKFLTRTEYRKRSSSEFLQQIKANYPGYLIIPEGGSAAKAVLGVSEVIPEIIQQQDFDTIITPVGSGGTIAGLINGCLPFNKQVIGVAVLKNASYLKQDIENLVSSQVSNTVQWQLLTQYHGGGYAKFSQQDCQQMLEFMAETNLPIEPIYSGKMILAFLDLLRQGYFHSGHKIMLLHTGGLQGLHGMVARGLINSDHWPVPKFEVQ